MRLISTLVKSFIGVSGAYVAGVMYPDKTKEAFNAATNKGGEILFGPDPDEKPEAAENSDGGLVGAAQKKTENYFLGPDPNAPNPKKVDEKETPVDEKNTSAQPTPKGEDEGTWDGIMAQGQRNRKWVSDLIDHPLKTVFGDSSKEPGKKSTPFSWLGNILGGKNDLGEFGIGSLAKTGGFFGVGTFLLNAMRGGNSMMSSALILGIGMAAFNYFPEIKQKLEQLTDHKFNKIAGDEVSIPSNIADASDEVSIPDEIDYDNPALEM